jgi:hypothetical protein
MNIVVGNTYLFQLTATIDGSIWNLSGATVRLFLRKPNGDEITRTATITNSSGGVASYTSLAGDLDTAGIWKRAWEVDQGSIIQRSDVIQFTVDASP